MGETTISNIKKESVAGTGTSLKKKWEKKLRIIVQEKQQSANWRNGAINFLNDYGEANEEERRRLSLAISKWNYENSSAEKKQNNIIFNNIGRFRHHINCGSTGPSMVAPRKKNNNNKLTPSFSGFKSQIFLHKSSHNGVSGTDNDEQSLNNSASVWNLWLLEAFSW